MVASAARVHVLVALCLVAQLIATVPHSVCRGCNVSESFACGFRRREGATAQQQTFLPCGCLGRRARRCTRRARRVRCPCRPHSLVIIRVDCLSAHRSPRFWAGVLGPLASLRSRPVQTALLAWSRVQLMHLAPSNGPVSRLKTGVGGGANQVPSARQ